jgi:hypothetical protein
MKKALFLAIGLLFGIASVVAAQPVASTGNVANTSQQGSVLVFPNIDVSSSKDTLITISNGNSVAVNIECVWIPQGWPTLVPYQDFQITLTPNQPFAFEAGYGVGGIIPFPTNYSTVGELKCWATDGNFANQINFNFLSGSAKVIDFSAYTAYEYNAWIFKALAGTTGATVGTAGTIALDGVSYQACPQYFLGNFFGSGSDYGFIKDTSITLVPCKQDLREEKTPVVTKAQFTVWGANENGYSGAVQCVTNWFEGSLGSIINGNQFTSCSLHGAAARFRVTGVASQVCATSQATPLIGLLVEDLSFNYNLTPTVGSTKSQSLGGSGCALTASPGFGAGIDATGWIKWDTQGAPVSAKKK